MTATQKAAIAYHREMMIMHLKAAARIRGIDSPADTQRTQLAKHEWDARSHSQVINSLRAKAGFKPSW